MSNARPLIATVSAAIWAGLYAAKVDDLWAVVLAATACVCFSLQALLDATRSDRTT